MKTVAATSGPSPGSPSPPTNSWWLVRNRRPMTDRITMAKTEMTTLQRQLLAIRLAAWGGPRAAYQDQACIALTRGFMATDCRDSLPEMKGSRGSKELRGRPKWGAAVSRVQRSVVDVGALP
jgi:hypothetical protein